MDQGLLTLLWYQQVLLYCCVQNREKVASTIHRQDTITGLKKFNARRKLKVRILTKPDMGKETCL